MLFKDRNTVTEFYPTFLKEDRSYLRKINEMVKVAESHIYIASPWITLGEELVVPLENAFANHPDLELYLVTKLQKVDVFNRIQQLDDIEKWIDVLDGQMQVKYNNQLHSKMIIVDDEEVMIGSSNLTGSGLGSPREYEGAPQIESNIFTNDENTVKDISDFFGRIWHHESSNDYHDGKYVLSCKSYNLSGIFQKYKRDFQKIVEKEGMKYQNDEITFNGILSYSDKERAYLTGKTRKDIALKIINPGNEFLMYEIGDEVSIKGKIHKIAGLGEFVVDINQKPGKTIQPTSGKTIQPTSEKIEINPPSEKKVHLVSEKKVSPPPEKVEIHPSTEKIVSSKSGKIEISQTSEKVVHPSPDKTGVHPNSDKADIHVTSDKIDIPPISEKIDAHPTTGKKHMGNNQSRISEISNLTEGLYNIDLTATVVSIIGPKKLDTKIGEKFLTLIELQDDSGKMFFELWNDNSTELMEEGEDIEIINAYIKEYKGNIRLALQKNGEMKIAGENIKW